MGIGAATCADYAKGYQENPALIKSEMVTWSLGYLTAMNAMAYGQTGKWKNLDPLTPNTIISAANNYCADNPLRSWSEGIYIFFNSLKNIEE